jgi:hypothetical protein
MREFYSYGINKIDSWRDTVGGQCNLGIVVVIYKINDTSYSFCYASNGIEIWVLNVVTEKMLPMYFDLIPECKLSRLLFL